MSMRRHPLLRWLLLVVLLINGTVTTSAWAKNLPLAAATQNSNQTSDHGGRQSSAMPEHCADAMTAAATETGDVTTPPAHHEHNHMSTDGSTGGCCAPGACHCASSTLPGVVSLAPVRAPLLRVASIATLDQRAAPAPALTRHFRPPIR